MTVLAVIQQVCSAVGVSVPLTSAFANINTNRTMREMVDLATEMAQRIAGDHREWTKMKQVATFVGDGVIDVNGVMQGTAAFNMPANYKRMLLSANVWRSTSTQQAMIFVPDTDEWLNRRYSGLAASAWGEWTMVGGQMLIAPIMAVGVSVYFAYLDKNCVALASGGYGDQFMTDGDSFRLDERLLKLGMIWQWKANKGSSYAEDLSTYDDALNVLSGADQPAPIIVGRYPHMDRRHAQFHR